MTSDQKPASPEQARLAEYQVWDRVEGRLWSRARLILVASVILILVVALLGVPLIEERIDRRVTARAEKLIAERFAADGVDVPALRQELRDESYNQRQELARSQFALEKRINSLLERTAELATTKSAFEEGTAEFESTQAEIRKIRQELKDEEVRLTRLRGTFERKLTEFQDRGQVLLEQIPKTTTNALRYVEQTVNRDLDELRMIVADQVAGKPAIYSTYVNLEHRDGQITGVNFGEERGQVFVRLRTFEFDSAHPISETESIPLQSTQWNGTRINLRFPAPAQEKILEARLAAAAGRAKPPTFRYGFLVQTSEGKLSQWSGLRSDSLIPPTNSRPKDD